MDSLAPCIFGRGEDDKAIPYFKKALELNPKGDAGLLLGIIALSRKDYPTAEKELKDHINRLPKDADGYVHLAKLYTQQEKYDEAVASYETAVRLDYTLNRHIIDAGKIYEDRGEYDKAVALYKRTLKYLRKYPHRRCFKECRGKLAK
jgi:tetratricopeptide (TPR) repeat protein